MQNEQFFKVLRFFTWLWVMTAVGLLIGVFMPPALVMPLSIVTVVLLVLMMFSRTMQRLSKWISFIVALLTGITLYSLLNFYIGALGGQLVIAVFGTTAAIFIVAGLVGYFSKRNFQSWGTYLFIAVIGLVVFSIIAIFVDFGDIVWVIVSAIGVIVFTLYTFYDMNQLAKNHISDEEVPLVALNLYLDFINLFKDLLRLVYSIKNLLGR